MKDNLQFDGILSLGYGIMPLSVIADRRLSKGAVILYAVLSSYARNNTEAYPGQKKLADILGVRVQTVSELSSELELSGYISKLRNRKNGGLTYRMNSVIPVEVTQELFGEVCSEKKQKEKKPKSEISIDDITKIKDLYFQLFKEQSPHEPDWTYARDNAIIVKYIKKYGIELLEKLIQEYFKSDWGRKVGFTLPAFQTSINSLLPKIEKKERNFGYEK